jgi:protein ImuB
MRDRRIACVRLPDFGLELKSPKQRAPVVLASGAAASGTILAVNEMARDLHVQAGMTVAQGQARAPDLQVEIRDEKREHRVSRQVVQKLRSLSPCVEVEAPGLYYLEALGQGRLHPSERVFARRILAAVRACGFCAAVGVAGHRAAAGAAAAISQPGTCTVIPPGREAKFLAALPVERLKLPDAMHAQLHALGLSTVAQVAALPASELAERFGHAGAVAVRRARGEAVEHFRPEALFEDLSRAVPFVFPLFCRQTVTAYVESMLKELFGTLQQRNRACRRVHIRLHFEDGQQETMELAVARPSLVVSRFVRQLEPKLEGRRTAGIKGIEVRIAAVAVPPSDQLPLQPAVPPRAVEKEQIPRPPGPVYAAQLIAAALPEAGFALQPVTRAPTRARQPQQSLSRPVFCAGSIAGLRLLQPPRRAEVTGDGGVPHTVRVTGRPERIRHRRGPWELSGGWWDGDFHRLYYEVETQAERRYLLFLDRLDAAWFLHGIFD